MIYQQRMLSFSAGLFLLGCAVSPATGVSEGADDTRLLGQWSCQLRLSENDTDAVASWTERLTADGVLEAIADVSSVIGEAVIQSHFSGRGRWSAQDGVYRNKLESVDLKMEGDQAIIEQLNKDEIRRGFMVPNMESYELKGERWTRRKSDASSVTVCQRVG